MLKLKSMVLFISMIIMIVLIAVSCDLVANTSTTGDGDTTSDVINDDGTATGGTTTEGDTVTDTGGTSTDGDTETNTGTNTDTGGTTTDGETGSDVVEEGETDQAQSVLAPGSRIVFIREYENYNTSENYSNIFMMSDTGDNLVQLTTTENGKYYKNPALSPNGDKVVYTLDSDIYIMTIEDKTTVQLTDTTAVAAAETQYDNEDYADNYPSFSSDGTVIIFNREFERWDSVNSSTMYHSDIYIMNADGTNLIKLTDAANQERYRAPELSPDGSKIVYMFNGADDVANTDGIYIMNDDGSNQVQLTDTDAVAAADASYDGEEYLDKHPEFSPDGSLIIFYRDFEYADMATSSLIYYADIFYMNIDGSSLMKVTNATHEDFYRNPSMSNSGHFVCRYKNNIVLVGMDGQLLQQLTDTDTLNTTGNYYVDKYPSYN